MEDGGSEYGILGYSSSPITKPDSPRQEVETTEEERKPEDIKIKRDDKQERESGDGDGGFINHHLSNFIPATADETTSMKAEEEEKTDSRRSSTNDKRKLADALSHDEAEDDEGRGGVNRQSNTCNSESSGFIGGIISSLFPHHHDVVKAHDEDGEEEEDINSQKKKVESSDDAASKEENVGGIIRNIVSHLPHPIAGYYLARLARERNLLFHALLLLF